MLTQAQNAIVYLMFLNGILFLGLNFVAYSIIFPGPRGSKRIGYVLIVTVFLAVLVQQEYRTLLYLDYPPDRSLQILLGGCVLPFFLLPMVYYRYRRDRMEREKSNPRTQEKHDTH